MSDKLGQLLVKSGKISKAQYQEAAEMKKTIGGSIIQVLTKLRYIKEDDLAHFLAKEAGVPVRKLHELVVSPKVSALLDLDVIEKHHVLPIDKRGGMLVLVVPDPMDFDTVEEIRFLTGMDIELNVATRRDINKAIDHYFRGAPCEVLTKAEKGDTPTRPKLDHVSTDVQSRSIAESLARLLFKKGVLTRDELDQLLTGSPTKKP